MKIHKLKTWPEYFEAKWQKQKTFEIRENDRDYMVGDILNEYEYHPRIKEYSGRMIKSKVTYCMTDSDFVKKGFAVMALRELARKEPK